MPPASDASRTACAWEAARGVQKQAKTATARRRRRGARGQGQGRDRDRGRHRDRPLHCPWDPGETKPRPEKKKPPHGGPSLSDPPSSVEPAVRFIGTKRAHNCE